MPSSFVVVPQWQGSGSARAMQLVDGADAIQGDLPASATLRVEVPLEAGDDQGSGILRLSSVQVVRERVTEALALLADPVIVIGGDCGVEWGAIERFSLDDDVALVWFDAHADSNSPETSPSSAFHGMVVRRLVDEGFAASRVVLAGTRAVDPGEAAFIEEHGIRMLGADALAAPDALVEAVAATGASRVYVHVDLDVLDPGEIAGVQYPEPFGLATGTLVAAIGALRARFDLAGAGITEFAPSSPAAAVDDLPTVLRIISALTRRV